MRTIEEVVEDLKRLTLHSAPIDFLLNEILEIHKVEKRPKGKWIPQWEKEGDFSSLRMCSECKVDAIIDGWGEEQRTQFCPNCGADMRGDGLKQ